MIVLKTESQIDKIREACRITAAYLQLVIDVVSVTAGMTTKEIDKIGEIFAMDSGGVPAFKGYKGFPYSICASVNDEVVHGIPNDRPLQEGDILSIDYGVLLDGYYSDSAITIPIGEVSDEAKKLIKTGQECLYRGISNFCEGSRLNKISHSIQTHAESNGFNVVRDFVGHGLGKNLHEDPQVYNFTNEPNEGLLFQRGAVLAIEPMIVEGDYKLVIGDNGWTVKTADGKLSAHWEHTIALTDKGTEILTLRKGENYELFKNQHGLL
jgi:methionyl aminopeptidase